MTKAEKKELSNALNIIMGTKDVTFDQMSGKNVQAVYDAMIKINDQCNLLLEQTKVNG